MKSIYCSNSLENMKKQINRIIPTSPERILDAPEFRDDYYLNLIDWSSNNLMAVGLNKEVYLWHAINGSISELLSLDSESSDYITSTAWSQIKGINKIK
jgi:cell division cycle protein 20 (cofactor of APC complex)